MGWVIQIVVMFGDLLLLAAGVLVVLFAATSGSVLVLVIAVYLIINSYRSWIDQGGLIAWTDWRKFMANWNRR